MKEKIVCHVVNLMDHMVDLFYRAWVQWVFDFNSYKCYILHIFNIDPTLYNSIKSIFNNFKNVFNLHLLTFF